MNFFFQFSLIKKVQSIERSECKSDLHEAKMGLLNHYFVPLMGILTLPVAVQLLANYPRDEGLAGFKINMLFGNSFSWTVVPIWIIWCGFFLWIPFDHYKGPITPEGYHPVYSNNFAPLQKSSILVYCGLHGLWPKLSFNVYQNFPYIMGTTNIVGLMFCGWLWWNGKRQPKTKDNAKRGSFLHDFYYGVEKHPTILNIDIKQLVIVRIGWMSLSIFITNFILFSILEGGFNPGLIVSSLLQLHYLNKFATWEPGYLTTPDITDSRAGFLTCWTAMNWMPIIHVYTSYYFVNHFPIISYTELAVIFIVSVFIINVKFQIDNEKDTFKDSNGNCQIRGKQPLFVEAEYQTANGVQKNKLLASGFWGLARHLNYTFEILSVVSWAIIGYRLKSFQPFLYLFYLILLLLYRCYKDETKCTKKYGTYWKQYCQIAKYKMIPYVF